METVKRYREYIKAILAEHANYLPEGTDVEREQLIDEVGDHYQLLSIGWNDHRRIYGCVMHFDIRDGKIWIQHDGTEVGVANLLVERGVPKDDIVLAFHPPYKRPYTEFAIG